VREQGVYQQLLSHLAYLRLAAAVERGDAVMGALEPGLEIGERSVRAWQHPPVITAAGDSCGSTTSCAPTADLIATINPTAVLTVGDNAYEDGTLAEYNA
jgi:hypothetical protein